MLVKLTNNITGDPTPALPDNLFPETSYAGLPAYHDIEQTWFSWYHEPNDHYILSEELGAGDGPDDPHWTHIGDNGSGAYIPAGSAFGSIQFLPNLPKLPDFRYNNSQFLRRVVTGGVALGNKIPHTKSTCCQAEKFCLTLIAVSNSWRALTAGQRTAWGAFAHLHWACRPYRITLPMTGWKMFSQIAFASHWYNDTHLDWNDWSDWCILWNVQVTECSVATQKITVEVEFDDPGLPSHHNVIRVFVCRPSYNLRPNMLRQTRQGAYRICYDQDPGPYVIRFASPWKLVFLEKISLWVSVHDTYLGIHSWPVFGTVVWL